MLTINSRVISITPFASKRGVESGRATEQVLEPGTVASFCELPVGAVFRMIAGRWTMRKLTPQTATRVDCNGLDLAHEFDGQERCVLVGSQTI